MRIIVVAAAALLLASPAAAQRNDYGRFRPSDTEVERRLSPSFARCIDASGGVTSAMRDCSSQEYRRQDGALNAGYRRAMARLRTPAARIRLRDLQRAWLRDREAHCRRVVEEHGSGGGTMDLLIDDSCWVTELVRRTMWLERYR